MLFEDFGYDGYDVSLYQDINTTPQKIDFKKMAGFASFVVIRAGQDIYADEDFKDNWRNARGVLPRSAYWFGDKDSSGVSQAQRFWNLIKDDQPEGPVFIDFEKGSWLDWNQLYNFIVELQRLSGYPDDKIGVYTGYYHWFAYGPKTEAQNAWFGKYLLWIAWYSTKASDVILPLPWRGVGCLLWQDAIHTNGLEVGVESKEIDHDKFNGDEEKFKRYFGQEPQVPEGDTMILYYADLKSGYISNVRTSPDLDATTGVQQIVGPLTVSIISEKTTTDNYDWYQISAPVSGWIALTNAYTNFRQATPVAAYPVEATIKMSDGSVYSGKVTKQ